MSNETVEEKRSHLRRRALKGAKIVFNHRASVIDCTVRDLSQGGARLQVTTPVGLPAVFDLVFDSDNTSLPCRLVWQTKQEVGVEFVVHRSIA